MPYVQRETAMKNGEIDATGAETALLLSATTSKGANGIGCEVVLTHGEKGVGGGNGDFYIPAFCSFLALPSVREKPLLQFLAAGIVRVCWDMRTTQRQCVDGTCT